MFLDTDIGLSQHLTPKNPVAKEIENVEVKRLIIGLDLGTLVHKKGGEPLMVLVLKCILELIEPAFKVLCGYVIEKENHFFLSLVVWLVVVRNRFCVNGLKVDCCIRCDEIVYATIWKLHSVQRAVVWIIHAATTESALLGKHFNCPFVRICAAKTWDLYETG